MDRKTKNRLRGIMAGIFCVGVLTGGIGTGVAFADFSGFTYALIKGDEAAFQTETFTYQIEPEDGERIWLWESVSGQPCRIKEEASVPEGTLEFVVVYDAERCRPVMMPQRGREDERLIQLYLEYHDNDLEDLMKYKDQFLEGLKDGQWREYQAEYVKSLECRVNPADREKLQFY